MKKLLRLAAIAMMGLSLSAFGFGAVSADTAGIDTTGPDSNNTVAFNSESEYELENDNDVRVRNRTEQRGYSGDVTVRRNTTSDGAAVSGEVMNDAWTRTAVTVDNSGAGGGCACNVGNGGGDNTGTIDMTGPNSNNHITFNNETEVEIENDNEIDVMNYTEQHAASGNVRVSGNTSAGGARSGAVTNVSTTETVVNATN